VRDFCKEKITGGVREFPIIRKEGSVTIEGGNMTKQSSGVGKRPKNVESRGGGRDLQKDLLRSNLGDKKQGLVTSSLKGGNQNERSSKGIEQNSPPLRDQTSFKKMGLQGSEGGKHWFRTGSDSKPCKRARLWHPAKKVWGSEKIGSEAGGANPPHEKRGSEGDSALV